VGKDVRVKKQIDTVDFQGKTYCIIVNRGYPELSNGRDDLSKPYFWGYWNKQNPGVMNIEMFKDEQGNRIRFKTEKDAVKYAKKKIPEILKAEI
jgi:hypothetical protein